MNKYLRLLRVHHYIKNFLVFAALAFSGQMFNLDRLKAVSIAFLVFCAVSSSIYIINDIRDIEKDRLHPTKCNRPLAKGEISIKTAWFLLAILILFASICSLLLHSISASLLIIIYFALNLAYSFKLKNYPIIDIAILVSGFLIRIYYGAIVTGISVSNWLYLTVLALSFFFAMGKRRNELKTVGCETRTVLKGYPIGFLDKGMTMCLTLTNVFYALWTAEKTTTESYNKFLIFTVPIVLLITLKYSINIEGDSDGDPVEVLLHDKMLLILCMVYVLSMFGIIYLLK